MVNHVTMISRCLPSWCLPSLGFTTILMLNQHLEPSFHWNLNWKIVEANNGHWILGVSKFPQHFFHDQIVRSDWTNDWYGMIWVLSQKVVSPKIWDPTTIQNWDTFYRSIHTSPCQNILDRFLISYHLSPILSLFCCWIRETSSVLGQNMVLIIYLTC